MRILFIIFIVFQFSFACYSQKNKNIIMAVADTMHYRQCQKYNQQQNLYDLTKTNDSLFFRLTSSYIPSGRKVVFELKKTSNTWQSRIIWLGEDDYPCFTFYYVLFDKFHLMESKKTKRLNYKEQLKIDPLDFFENGAILFDSIRPEIIAQVLFQYKSLSEMDTSTYDIALDTTYYINVEIEISTLNKYKYLYWPNIYGISENYFSDKIKGIEYALLELKGESKSKYKLKNYRKNRWPK